MSSFKPTYATGEFVTLITPLPGFPDSTRFKVVLARAIGAGQFRYELEANGQSVWVLEADLRAAHEQGSSVSSEPGNGERNLSMTQRMQTMSLAERMAAMGVTEFDSNAATQRMKVLGGNSTPGTTAPPIDGPVTGGPFADDNKATKSGAQKPGAGPAANKSRK